MMSFLHTLFIVSTVLNLTAAASFTTVPTPINITLYSTASFECATSGGALYWIVNGTDRPARWNEGITFNTRQVSGTEYRSTLVIHATVANNNTQVQCGVLGNTSSPVLLLIQGKLAPPRNVAVNSSNCSQLHLIWEEPPTLDLTEDNEMSILNYSVTIVNLNNGTERVVNTTRNEYIFIREDYVHCGHVFRFHVAGYNEAGMGYQSEGIEAAFLGPTIITGPTNVSTLITDEAATFHCSLLCGEVNVDVMWYINDNKISNMDSSSYQTSSDYHNCSSGALNYTETLKINVPSFIDSDYYTNNDTVTVYCSAIQGLTNKIKHTRDKEVTQCYSRNAYLTVTNIPENTHQSRTTISPGTSPTEPQILINNTTTTQDDEQDPNESSSQDRTSSETLNRLLLPICIGQAVLLILFTLVSIGVVVCVLIKKSQANKRQEKVIPDDPVYAIPFSVQLGGKNDDIKSSMNRVAIEHETGDTDGERIYDQPKTPSPQPDMQPCAAYHTTRRHHH